MIVVCDASVVVAALVDAGAAGEWATGRMAGASLAAPATLQAEVASVLRRHERAGVLGGGQAAQAHADLVALPVESWPYAPLAPRVWGCAPTSRRTTRAMRRWPRSLTRRSRRSTRAWLARPRARVGCSIRECQRENLSKW